MDGLLGQRKAIAPSLYHGGWGRTHTRGRKRGEWEGGAGVLVDADSTDPRLGSPREQRRFLGSPQLLRRRAEGGALCPRPAQPQTGTLSLSVPWLKNGLWGSRRAPALSGGAARQAGSGSRLPACRGEEGALGTPAGTARCPTPQPAESAEHDAKNTAAGAAEAARRGGERGAAGAGTAPALSAAHLPTPRSVPTWTKPRGAQDLCLN